MSMEFPNEGPPGRELTRLIDSAYRRERTEYDEAGVSHTKAVPDRIALFFASQSISTNEFGPVGTAYGIVDWCREQCHKHLPQTWAEEMAAQMTAWIEGTRLGIAAKNSETLRQGKGEISSLQDKQAKHKTERVEIVKNDGGGLLERFGGGGGD